MSFGGTEEEVTERADFPTDKIQKVGASQLSALLGIGSVLVLVLQLSYMYVRFQTFGNATETRPDQTLPLILISEGVGVTSHPPSCAWAPVCSFWPGWNRYDTAVQQCGVG